VDKLKALIKESLAAGKVAGVVGIKREDGHPRPALFMKENIGEVESLVIDENRYPLAQVLLKISRKHPDATLGVVVRGCDERAIIELIRNEQLKKEQVVCFGVPCDVKMADACKCPQPYPNEVVEGDKTAPVSDADEMKHLEGLSKEEKLHYWMGQFSKCIKCYGCRNICPACFCDSCALDDKELISTGFMPPEIPIFHLVKAFHMAERCSDCGLCEEVCPANIPLRKLCKKVREIMGDKFDFLPGTLKDGKGPLQLLGDGKFGPEGTE
jgi:formate dehydrogenase (coenzyme F420) beta subunit